MSIFDDLADEYARLDTILASLRDADWDTPSAAAEWTIADVVAHLALTEEFVLATLAQPWSEWTERGSGIDDRVAESVSSAALTGPDAFVRWRAASRRSVDALRSADPAVSVRWAAAPLRPRTLATTRLAEHWAHALDIAEPLDVALPDTGRLRHIAWLGHATLPYAFANTGHDPRPIRAELFGPDGDRWAFGPADADSTISGSAGAFCRVGAQRRRPEDSGLATAGPFGEVALRLLRNYAV